MREVRRAHRTPRHADLTKRRRQAIELRSAGLSLQAIVGRLGVSRERMRLVEARSVVFDFIEGWYNPNRRHCRLDYRSPINYERSHSAQADCRSGSVRNFVCEQLVVNGCLTQQSPTATA